MEATVPATVIPEPETRTSKPETQNLKPSKLLMRAGAGCFPETEIFLAVQADPPPLPPH